MKAYMLCVYDTCGFNLKKMLYVWKDYLNNIRNYYEKYDFFF